MKHSRILSLLLLVGATLFFTGCDDGDDNKTSDKQKQIDQLVGTWNVQQVTYNTDITAEYQNPTFKLVISDNGDDGLNFVAQDRPSGKLTPWPADGGFAFGSNVATELIRSPDGITITYSVTDGALNMEFEYTGEGYTAAKTGTVDGPWSFRFTK